MSDKKPTSKIEFGEEKILNTSTRFTHLKTGEILTFLRFSDKAFQRTQLAIYKKVSDNSEIECSSDEVKRLED